MPFEMLGTISISSQAFMSSGFYFKLIKKEKCSAYFCKLIMNFCAIDSLSTDLHLRAAIREKLIKNETNFSVIYCLKLFL
jgi:hypothetical protein